MDMTWESLTKFFTWAAQHGSEAPMADTAGQTLVIDGAIMKEDWDRFMASHSEATGMITVETPDRGPIQVTGNMPSAGLARI